jgi:hypothetical protein
MLTLEQNSDADREDSYLVYFEGQYVGRVFFAGADAPKDQPKTSGKSGPEAIDRN